MRGILCFCWLESTGYGPINRNKQKGNKIVTTLYKHRVETKKQLIPSKPITKTIVDIFTDASIKYADSMSESLFDIKKIESITGGAVMMHNKQVVEYNRLGYYSDKIL